jgi:NAD(P)H-dependent FMN reductase
MKVLGIVGSPRREKGFSHRIVREVLSGAQAAGAETEVMYLVDERPEYCIHCGHGCFDTGVCAQEDAATARSGQIGAADALVVCAPVYCWQVNGLTAALFDKARMPTGSWNRGAQHGRSALGIAVAGGTGTGVFPALQSIYAWLCLWKFRPLDPVPVTRFNLAAVLERAASYGRTLAESRPRPFEGTWEQALTYDALSYMAYGRVDEFRWLAEQIATGLESRDGDREQVKATVHLLEQGRAYAAAGDRSGEARSIIQAYRSGAEAW